MDFVEYIRSMCASGGIGSINVESPELVSLSFSDGEGHSFPILIKPCGETVGGERVIELSAQALELPDVDDEVIQELLLQLNGQSSGKLGFWGRSPGKDGDGWYASYWRFVASDTATANSFASAVASVAYDVQSIRRRLTDIIKAMQEANSD